MHTIIDILRNRARASFRMRIFLTYPFACGASSPGQGAPQRIRMFHMWILKSIRCVRNDYREDNDGRNGGNSFCYDAMKTPSFYGIFGQ